MRIAREERTLPQSGCSPDSRLGPLWEGAEAAVAAIPLHPCGTLPLRGEAGERIASQFVNRLAMTMFFCAFGSGLGEGRVKTLPYG